MPTILWNSHRFYSKRKKEECNWKETAKDVILRLYEQAGKPTPYWIDYFIEEKQLEDSIDDLRLSLRAFLINLINDTYNKYTRNFNIDNTLLDRFSSCCNNRLIPSISVIDNHQTFVIFGSFMKELHNPRSGIDNSEIASLNELANTIGLAYGQKWLNGLLFNTSSLFGFIFSALL